MKKIISVVLAIIMAFSVLIVPASANDAGGQVQNSVAIATTVFDVIKDIVAFIHSLMDSLYAMLNIDCPFCEDDLTVPDAEKGITISKDNFVYDNTTDMYSFSDVIDCINGTVVNVEKVESLTFTVKDLNDNLLDSGKIAINENWSTSDVDFMLGENKLIVTANYSNGGVSTETISVKCYNDAYMENLNIDTETDTDGDKLVDYLELNHTNTDINKIDTDEDGLTDYEDVYLFDYNPLSKDSDNDGILDCDEDYDADKISNIDEINLGLDPTYADSDLDGLNDYDEINVYLTAPLKKDTDEDGVSDGDEVRIGTNPLRKENVFTETQQYGEITENTPISVQVSAELDGEQVGTLDINTVTYSDNKMISPTVPGYLGMAYDFSVEGQIDSAEIVFNYDTSLGELGSDFQPRIYYFNETTKMFEELPNQKVENGKVTAKVEHFSTYILLNKVDFDKVWNNEIKSPVVDENGNTGLIDVAFVIDSSGSMSSSGRLSTAKTALRTFVNALGEDDRAALIKFTSYATVLTDLTKDKSIVTNKISSLSASGTTAMYKGLTSAINLLTKENEQYGYKMIIVLTDGYDEPSTSYNGYYKNLVDKAKDNNIVIYTVGTGTMDKNLLTKIATETGGSYYIATATSGILDSFEYIKENTVDLTADKNCDKIPDYYNDLIFKGEMVLSNGSDEFMGINFNYGEEQNPDVLCADMDGDGLLNGEELIIRENGDYVYIEMISDPCMKNSDTDEYDDYFEINDYSDPLSPSYETDVLNYFLDDGNFTYYDVFEGESGWLDTVSRNIWSTVTLNWSHKDEAQGILTNFLTKQADLENIENSANAIEKEMGSNLAAQVIDFLTDELIEYVGSAWDTIDSVDKFAHLKINMKKWVSAGNSSKYFGGNSWWSQFNAQISKYNKWSKSWKWVSKAGDIMGYLPVISVGLDEIKNIYDYAKTYSTLAATSESFIIFEDILETIVNNDDMDEKFVAKGAQPILDSIKNSNNNFIDDYCRDISVETAENIGYIAVTLLSTHNPLLIAINIIIGLIDEFWLGDISEGAYALYVVKEMVDASKTLIDYENSTWYSNFEESEKIYLRFIWKARIEGGNQAKKIVNKQIFWGEKDSEARARICKYIDSDNQILDAYAYSLGLR